MRLRPIPDYLNVQENKNNKMTVEIRSKCWKYIIQPKTIRRNMTKHKLDAIPGSPWLWVPQFLEDILVKGWKLPNSSASLLDCQITSNTFIFSDESLFSLHCSRNWTDNVQHQGRNLCSESNVSFCESDVIK